MVELKSATVNMNKDNKMTDIEILRENYKTELKKVFQEGAQKLFDDLPELESFSWTQYTPYFNDGDPCEFDVHTSWPRLEFSDTISRVAIDDRKVKHFVTKFLDSIDQSYYLDMFGDHVEVTVYRNGNLKIEEYDHD